jgi:hypothetical protein
MNNLSERQEDFKTSYEDQIKVIIILRARKNAGH